MAKPLNATLVLISAAGTEWNESGRLLGRSAVLPTDAALTEMHARAVGLAKELAPIDLVLCGPEDSARSSASLVSEAFRTKCRCLDSLANIDLGLWEGTLRSELEGRCPSAYKTWQEQPEGIRPPEGESLGDALDRAGEGIRKAIEKLKAKPDQQPPRVAVVVRSMLWAGLIARLDSDLASGFWTLAGETGSVRSYEIALTQLTPGPASVSA
jgi:broad specificity phosphatase PhoE